MGKTYDIFTLVDFFEYDDKKMLFFKGIKKRWIVIELDSRAPIIILNLRISEIKLQAKLNFCSKNRFINQSFFEENSHLRWACLGDK